MKEGKVAVGPASLPKDHTVDRLPAPGHAESLRNGGGKEAIAQWRMGEEVPLAGTNPNGVLKTATRRGDLRGWAG